jgi:hypothetical protein
MISAATGIITTIAGGSEPGCSGESGSALDARFIGPNRLTLGAGGTIFLTDSECGQIFKLTPTPVYAGFVDGANCQTVSGWALDKNRPGVSITVSIYDGTTLVGTVTANQSRPDVASIAGDSGLHGFTYTVPASLKDGGAHSIHIVYESNSGLDLPGSRKTLTCAPTYTGHVDTASCSGITGWIADRTRLNQALTVTLWDGSTQIASAVASAPRPDVGASIGDNGLHGFSLAIPAAYANGVPHALQIRYETSALQVPGSPATLTCGGTSYAGFVDSASCGGVSGWVADRNRPGVPITVTIWDGATQIASVTANGLRSDVGAYLGDNGLHAFLLPIPSGYSDGAPHTLQVHYEGSTVPVPGSPVKLTCGSTNYAGYVDTASCSGITGWVADRNRPGIPITVSLWDGGTSIASVTAASLRADVGSLLNDNGLHGFSMAVPPAYANGVPHSLQLHYESSGTAVPGSPVNLTCGRTAVNYTGYVDSASCSGITGWAADRGRPNSPIVVTLWDGATQIASTTANLLRSDVGVLLGDSGAHGFSMPIPAGSANGAAHTFQIRYETSTAQLPGPPATLTCGSSNYAGSVDVLSCSSISGWAADRSALNTSVNVSVYDGATLLTTIPANGSRGDVGTFLGDNGLHGFGVPTPTALKDGRAHTVTVRPGNSSSGLYGQQSLTCQP